MHSYLLSAPVMSDTFYLLFTRIQPIFFWYFLSINFVYIVLLLLGASKIFLRKKQLALEDFSFLITSNTLPAITFLMPAYNEGKHILAAIHNVLNLTYRYKEIIVVNDGSSDNSMEVMKQGLDLVEIPLYYQQHLHTQKVRGVYRSRAYPEVVVVDKDHGKKFDTLNAAINACQNAHFVIIDADTFIDDTHFETLIRPLLTDPTTIAIGASVRLRNGFSLDYNKIASLQKPMKLLPAMQSLEYLRAFLERQGWDYIGGNIVLSGAFSIFQKQAVVDVGGYVDTVAEDMEIIIRLHRFMKEHKRPYKISYLPDPVAWTEGPERLSSLARQRANWQRGMCDCLWYHRRAFFNPSYGRFGMFVIPFWLYGEAIEPFIELLGFLTIFIGYYYGAIHIAFVYLFLLVTLGFTLIFTLFCILIEELSFKKLSSLKTLTYFLFYNFLENVGYRQLTVFWRIRGTWNFFRDLKTVRKNSKRIDTLMKKKKG